MVSIDVVENEEASASVVVKMTDSFTEQADQVIPGRVPQACGTGTPGSGVPFFKCCLSDYESIRTHAGRFGENNAVKVNDPQSNSS